MTKNIDVEEGWETFLRGLERDFSPLIICGLQRMATPLKEPKSKEQENEIYSHYK
jgi:hypothetical protein